MHLISFDFETEFLDLQHREKTAFFWSADVLSGRHIVRCFLDILSGPSSDILSGLLGSAPDVLSGRLRIRHIVRRTFCQDWMDLHQTNCQDVYVDQSIFLVYWPYFWYVYDQISQFRPNFTISTKMAQKWPKIAKNDPKWPKKPRWPKMTQNGQKWPKMAQSDPNMTPDGPKWLWNDPKWPKIKQNVQKMYQKK